uniref:Rab-GAP TBC domain-containing protein n=1 Tax=Kalanchoe fedtschenkoi TaxID=63787 RepID=A0A7N0U776_KALFE
MLLSLLSKRTLEVDSRDAYGFTVRPQHLQRFKEYTSIFKEEEEERSDKWSKFLEQFVDLRDSYSSEEEPCEKSLAETPEGSDFIESEPLADTSTESKSNPEREILAAQQKSSSKVQTWAKIRPSLRGIQDLMSYRVKKRQVIKLPQTIASQNNLSSIQESANLEGVSDDENDLEEELEKDELDDATNSSKDGIPIGDGVTVESFFPWKEELELLVHGGVPRGLRGEVWQAFVGVKTRRIKGYYQELLVTEGNNGADNKPVEATLKWKKQIEKDLPRTFPGHPALNENGRDSLRRVLWAYALHNPSVGYCQAMNFFAGLLLLMMPEENAFWSLVGLIDDYFDGYFSEDMIESQVDQLVFEELMRERFPKLVNHLDYLGVQVAWISAPWFLSIFVNMLPWESVLRVWDVLLFEGNRVMLFRTALALMELYGPALVTTKDAADAISLLQSLAGSTFDSSQLVLTACMGYLAITEARLQDLRAKHRPSVMVVIEETLKGKVSKDSKVLATKLYSFKKPTTSQAEEKKSAEVVDEVTPHTESQSNLDELLNGLAVSEDTDSAPCLQEQVNWYKVELCRLLEEKRSAVLRAEELETALMEMVRQDNRRELSARVEQLQQEVGELKQVLADKKEQEAAMLQVLMRVEQEQKLTEDARRSAEQDAAAQKYAVHVLQEKYEKAIASIAQMEKRVVMAESMLEATLQYESGQVKLQSSPRGSRPGLQQNTRKIGLLSGFGWRNKGKPEDSSESKSTNEETNQNASK